jgi:hypothetical protein
MAENVRNPSVHQSNSMKTQAELDTFFAHIDLLRAENEAQGKELVRKWATPDVQARLDSSESRTQEAVDLEDSRLFQPQPLYLGVGAAIPPDFLANEAPSGTRALRKKFFPATTLKASKARDAEEKAASAKRGLKHNSSDDEEGRSGVGRTKKTRIYRANGPDGDPLREQTTINLLTGHRTSITESTQPSSPIKHQTNIGGNHERSVLEEIRGQESTSNTIESGPAGKKRRKKSKKKIVGNEQKIHTSEKTIPSQETVVNIGHDFTAGAYHGSDVEGMQKDNISGSTSTKLDTSIAAQMSKEQKKSDKKLRKEERRRQRRQGGVAGLETSLTT